VAKAEYHRKDTTQDDFIRLDKEIPSCVELVRFEELAVSFPKSVSHFIRKGATSPFCHANRTEYKTNIREVLTDEAKELLYQKHKFMFDSGLYSTNL